MLTKLAARLTGAATAMIAVTPVLAADLPARIAVAPVMPGNWSGFYAGLNVGGAWGTEDVSHNFPAGPVFNVPANLAAFNAAGAGSANASGVIGGVQIGYNRQNGAFVYGIEADFSGISASTSLSRSGAIPTSPANTFTVGSTARPDWLLTVRPRVGFAVDRSLLYVTGGLAMTQLRRSGSFIDDTPIPDIGAGSTSKLVPGWTIGAGWEYALGGNWSAKAEYLYASFAASPLDYTFDFTGSAGPNVVTSDGRLSLHVARLGVNYNFGMGTPAVAAVAAPRYVKARPVAVGGAYDWSGTYVGVNIGGTETESRFDSVAYPGVFGNPANLAAIGSGGTGNATRSGFSGGVQIGSNWQNGQLVYGIEADFTGISGNPTLATATPIPTSPADRFFVTNTARAEWLITVRPRIGVAFDRSLVYATGGVAIAQVKADSTFSDTLGAPADVGTGQSRRILGGWTVGGGYEYALAANWSIRGEYLYTELSSSPLNYGIDFPGNFNAPSQVVTTSRITTQTGRLGLNYRFGG